jgi:hypothetical protein
MRRPKTTRSLARPVARSIEKRPSPAHSVLLGDEGGEVAGFDHGPDKGLRVLAPGVEVAPVCVGESGAQLAHAAPDLLQFGDVRDHVPPPSGSGLVTPGE